MIEDITRLQSLHQSGLWVTRMSRLSLPTTLGRVWRRNKPVFYTKEISEWLDTVIWPSLWCLKDLWGTLLGRQHSIMLSMDDNFRLSIYLSIICRASMGIPKISGWSQRLASTRNPIWKHLFLGGYQNSWHYEFWSNWTLSCLIDGYNGFRPLRNP